jgi:hypothetical protein
MTGPAADTEQETLGGGDAVSRAIRASDGVELHYLRWCSGRAPPWAVAPTARLAIPLTPELYTGNPRAAAGHTLDFEPGRVLYLGEMVGWLSAMVGLVG